MKNINIKLKSTNELLLSNVLVTTSSIERIVGLMFKTKIENGSGLLIAPGNSIHTVFMKFNLDLVFMNRKNIVVKIIKNIKPWRMTRIYFSATKVLELPAGTLPENLKVNSEVIIEDV